jgi:hypothetical protein
VAKSGKEATADVLEQKAKGIIKSQLKSPATASFQNVKYSIFSEDSNIRTVLVAELDDIHGQYSTYRKLKRKYPDGVLYWFSGEVNAQNSFGALIQSHWHCVIFFSPKEGSSIYFDSHIQ